MLGLGEHEDQGRCTALSELYPNAMRSIEVLCRKSENYAKDAPKRPDETQVKAAKAGIMKLLDKSLPEPKMMLLDNGTLGAFWYIRGSDNTLISNDRLADGDVYVSMEFEPSGTIVWGIADEYGIEVDEFPEAEDIPEKVVSVLNKNYQTKKTVVIYI